MTDHEAARLDALALALFPLVFGTPAQTKAAAQQGPILTTPTTTNPQP
jgi:hypothetical protein